MTILLRCRLCKGTGEIPNEQYRIIQKLKSHDIKKYFHMPTEDDVTSNDSVFTLTSFRFKHTAPVHPGWSSAF